jgi:GDP-L-fucose synthase
MSFSPETIYIAGHTGLVGQAFVRKFQSDGNSTLLLRTQVVLDLTNQGEVSNFFSAEKPDFVILAAAKVGGIHANTTYPVEFIYENLMIQSNVIHQSYLYGVKKLSILGKYLRLSVTYTSAHERGGLVDRSFVA